MSKILIIDDDAALELVAENLRFRGHEVQRYSFNNSQMNSDHTLRQNV